MDILERTLKRIAPDSNKPVYFLEQQQSSSETEFICEAVKKTFIGLIEANKISREPAPLSKLNYWLGVWRFGWIFGNFCKSNIGLCF